MHTSYSTIIANRIRKLCNRKNMSVNQLALISGVGQSTLDNFLHGKTVNPKIRTLHKVAIAFNMTLAELLDFQELNEFSFEEEEQGESVTDLPDVG